MVSVPRDEGPSTKERKKKRNGAHLEPPSASKPQNSMMTCTCSSSELLLPRRRTAENAEIATSAFGGGESPMVDSSSHRATPYWNG